MEFRMDQVFNATEEIERSASYDNIRLRIFSQISHSQSSTLVQFLPTDVQSSPPDFGWTTG